MFRSNSANALALCCLTLLISACPSARNECGESFCGASEVCLDQTCLSPCNIHADCVASNNESCMDGLCQVVANDGGGTLVDAGSTVDAGAMADGGAALDAGAPADAGPVPDAAAQWDAAWAGDAAMPLDGGGADGGTVDGGNADVDGSNLDGGRGVADAAPQDAGVSDAGPLDAGSPDASLPDAGLPDSGPPDAGCTAPAWWNAEYATRIPTLIGPIPTDGTVELVLTDAQVTQLDGQKLDMSDDEIRVVRHPAGIDPVEIDRVIHRLPDGGLQIRFKAQEVGGIPTTTDVYWIYLGNSNPLPPLNDPHNVYAYYEDFDALNAAQDPAIEFQVTPATGWSFSTTEGKGTSLHPPPSTQRANLIFPMGSSIGDAYVSVTVKIIGSDVWNLAGGIARVTDSTQNDLDGLTTRLCQECAGGAGNVGVTQYNNGNFTNRSNYTQSISSDQWHRVEGYYHGTDVKVVFNQDGETTWTNAPLGMGSVGVYVFQSDVVMDEMIFAHGMEAANATLYLDDASARCP